MNSVGLPNSDQKISKLRRWIHVLFFLPIIVGLLGWGWFYLKRPTTLPFHHILIARSTQHTNPQYLTQLIRQHLQGGFFSLDTSRLSYILLDQPWIAHVALQRKWPDQLIVRIQEQSPAARWGAKGVISQRGILFYPAPKTISSDWPLLLGPDEAVQTVFSDFKALKTALEPLGLQIIVLKTNRYLDYQLTLSNHMTLAIGHDDLLFRIRRFVSLYPQLLRGKATEARYVDLRYSHGMAIQWQK